MRDSVLRPLDPVRDGPALHAIFGDEESCRYLPAPAFKTVEETIVQLKTWTDGYGDTSWAIVEAPGGEALGRAAIYRPVEDDGVWEVAVMVVPSAQGRGLAARAVAEAVNFGFDRKGARRIFADIDPDNTASVKVFERLGFHYEGRARALWKTHIGVRDSLIYSLLASDPRPGV
ncbi:MAG: GNAT family protein [Pseudomonadota bacterium]